MEFIKKIVRIIFMRKIVLTSAIMLSLTANTAFAENLDITPINLESERISIAQTVATPELSLQNTDSTQPVTLQDSNIKPVLN